MLPGAMAAPWHRAIAALVRFCTADGGSDHPQASQNIRANRVGRKLVSVPDKRYGELGEEFPWHLLGDSGLRNARALFVQKRPQQDVPQHHVFGVVVIAFRAVGGMMPAMEVGRIEYVIQPTAFHVDVTMREDPDVGSDGADPDDRVGGDP